MANDEIVLNDEELKLLKKFQVQILKEFVAVCEKLKLRYYAIGGTLLGAIKYRGFIPWDDDIDVCMPRPDYEVFLKEGQKLLPSNLFIQSITTDPYYPNNFAKVRNSNTTFIELSTKNIHMNQGIFIDVFPIDGYNEEKVKRAVFKIKYQIYTARITTAYYLPKERFARSFKGKIFLIFSRVVTAPFSLRTIVMKREKLLKKYNYNSCSIVANYCGVADKGAFPKEYLGEGIRKEFEGLSIVIPEGYDILLRSVFGDYNKPFPVEKRAAHHYCSTLDFNRSYTYYINGGKK